MLEMKPSEAEMTNCVSAGRESSAPNSANIPLKLGMTQASMMTTTIIATKKIAIG